MVSLVELNPSGMKRKTTFCVIKLKSTENDTGEKH